MKSDYLFLDAEIAFRHSKKYLLMVNSDTGSFWKSPVNAILASGFIAGTLDMLTAIFVYSVILHKVTALVLVQSIASGVFGKDAYSGGAAMAIAGVALHYLIAFSFAILYFLVFPKIPFLKNHRILSGLLYGIFAWVIMNLIVLPLVFTHRSPLTWSSVLIGASILMIMIGLPISIITHRYYTFRNR